MVSHVNFNKNTDIDNFVNKSEKLLLEDKKIEKCQEEMENNEKNNPENSNSGWGGYCVVM